MPERAEIEAVARAFLLAVDEHPPEVVDADGSWRIGGGALRAWEAAIVDLRVALDRVRDARGDDEGAQAMKIAGEIARGHAKRFPDGEPTCSSCGVRLNQDNAGEDATCCDYCVAKAARSSQGEDHEAGIEAAAEAMMDAGPGLTFGRLARIAVAAYLSRVSPSRDGTVAIEDVGKRALEIAEGLRDDPQQERWVIAAYEEGSATLEGEPTPVCRVQGPSTSSQGVEVVPLGDLAWAIASAEFDSARAGESNER
jgi:hypothetical protein